MSFHKLLISNLILVAAFSVQAAPSLFIDSLWTLDAGDIVAAGPLSAADGFDVLTEDRYGRSVLVNSANGHAVPSAMYTDPSRTHLLVDTQADGQVEILSFSHSDQPGPLTLSVFDGYTMATHWSAMVPGYDRIDSVDIADVVGDRQPEALVRSNGELFVYNMQNGALLYSLCADNFSPAPWQLEHCRELRLDKINLFDADGDGQMEILAHSRTYEGHAKSIAVIDTADDQLQIQWSVDDIEFVGHGSLVTATRDDIVVFDGRHGGVRLLSAVDGRELASMPRPNGNLDDINLRFVDSDSDGVMEMLQIDRNLMTPTSLTLYHFAAGQMQSVWSAGWPAISSVEAVYTAQFNDNGRLNIVVQSQGSVKILDAVTGKLEVDTAKEDLSSGDMQMDLKDWDGDGVIDLLVHWISHSSFGEALALLGQTDDGVGIKWYRKDTAFPILSGNISPSSGLEMVVATGRATEIISAADGKPLVPMPVEFGNAFENSKAGVRAQLFDVNSDGLAEMILTCPVGTPRLGTVFRFEGHKVVATAMAKTDTNVAVDEVAAADVDGDGQFELIYTTHSDDRNRLPGNVYVTNSVTGKILYKTETANAVPDSSVEILAIHDTDANGSQEVLIRSAASQLALIGLDPAL